MNVGFAADLLYGKWPKVRMLDNKKNTLSRFVPRRKNGKKEEKRKERQNYFPPPWKTNIRERMKSTQTAREREKQHKNRDLCSQNSSVLKGKGLKWKCPGLMTSNPQFKIQCLVREMFYKNVFAHLMSRLLLLQSITLPSFAKEEPAASASNVNATFDNKFLGEFESLSFFFSSKFLRSRSIRVANLPEDRATRSTNQDSTEVQSCLSHNPLDATK
ncbi:hypothetical protein CEXT_559901 [Caerostris extrusa]|uniref:Uncharacterized protein n=1 Tax=Caerostris extrusa TaxID=172846 RepID=A0AAV4PH11_CAEEX|nr:hypothetical protein CEXT_559901 [Caerostris extrusa]